MANDISLGTAPLSSDNILQPKIVYKATVTSSEIATTKIIANSRMEYFSLINVFGTIQNNPNGGTVSIGPAQYSFNIFVTSSGLENMGFRQIIPVYLWGNNYVRFNYTTETQWYITSLTTNSFVFRDDIHLSIAFIGTVTVQFIQF